MSVISSVMFPEVQGPIDWVWIIVNDAIASNADGYGFPVNSNGLG
jgi:hypothetical protein